MEYEIVKEGIINSWASFCTSSMILCIPNFFRYDLITSPSPFDVVYLCVIVIGCLNMSIDNILPETVIRKMRESDGRLIDTYANASVMFADIVGLVVFSFQLPLIPQGLFVVCLLNRILLS
eukprot:TRINITY_DN839_c0_g1_i6.p1 TRINITY_DN839_c0_g1~~TRINITY_DN839_c0_g1_i6.p1  ORF type:complete len:121 (+),score=6.17 TRINITY_DN839_c0_g1_i6:200-562(+)